MYNTIIRLVRGKQIPTKIIQESEKSKQSKSDKQDSDMPDTSFLADMSFESDLTESAHVDYDMPSIPGMNIDDALMSDPMVSEESAPQLKISTSLAAIRNFLKTKQEIDGSWGGRIDITAECLQAVLDQESVETDFIKSGLHYLLALQEKNGSWQDDVVLTSKVLKILSKINQSLATGGLIDAFN
jgi:hypothetical protein